MSERNLSSETFSQAAILIETWCQAPGSCPFNHHFNLPPAVNVTSESFKFQNRVAGYKRIGFNWWEADGLGSGVKYTSSFKRERAAGSVFKDARTSIRYLWGWEKSSRYIKIGTAARTNTIIRTISALRKALRLPWARAIVAQARLDQSRFL